MNQASVTHALHSGAVIAVIWSGSVWLSSRRPTTSSRPPYLAPAEFPQLIDGDSLAVVADDVVANDPFRPDRVVGSAAESPTPTSTQAARQLPHLVLRGVIGGPPWDAIIDGIPGRLAGAVLRSGENISGLSISIASRDSVRVTWADSTWTLLLGRR